MGSVQFKTLRDLLNKIILECFSAIVKCINLIILPPVMGIS